MSIGDDQGATGGRSGPPRAASRSPGAAIGEAAALERFSGLVIPALSEGRRTRAVLDRGPRRSFATDLSAVVVPYPFPMPIHHQDLICALALQCSPSKDVAAMIDLTTVHGRVLRALHWEEGQAAVHWVSATWPGLRDHLGRLFPSVSDEDTDGDAAALLERAERRARRGRVATPPPLFGQLLDLHPGTLSKFKRKTLVASPRSLGNARKRRGVLAMGAVGPSGESVDQAGSGAGVDALEGRAGHEMGIAYDEWDFRARRYRREYVRVHEVPHPQQGTTPTAPFNVYAPMTVRHRRRHTVDGDVDIDSVVEWRCSLAAGTGIDEPKLFAELNASPAIAAWTLLVDASTSSGAFGGTALQNNLRAADLVAATLERSRQRVAVYTFRSTSHDRVEVRVLKAADAPYRPLDTRLRAGGYTRIGAALRHVGRRLSEIPGHDHVLLSIGDGVPFDEGYDGQYGRSDVAKAVDEIRRKGAVVRHLVVGTTDQQSNLNEMFGAGAWDVVADVEDVLKQVRILTAELRSRS